MVLPSVYTPRRRCDVSTVCCFGIPAYGYPGSGGVWESLLRLDAGTLVIMDPADGPGRIIDPRYSAVVSDATRRGLRVYGYVTTDYGRRAAAAMAEEVERYREWYRPAGIFLDQTPGMIASNGAISEVVDRIRACKLSLAINPGQPEIDPEDAAMADQVINFEGPYAAYRQARFPTWVRDFPADRFWHLIYEVRDVRTMRRVAGMAGLAHAGVVYITDASMPNPWNRIPSYWQEEQKMLSSPTRRT
jgi:Spherulation-specific family 4